MDQDPQTQPKRHYAWPWIVLAAVVLGVLLSILWMTHAVRRIQLQRIPGSGVPSTPASTNRLSEFRDVLTGGNIEAGRKVFFEKPEANCAKCHKAEGNGGEQGPPLDGLGAQQSREYILESMLFPNERIIEGYEPVVLILTNGMGLSGIVKQENESELTLDTAEDGLTTLNKAQIQTRMKGLSPMPEGFSQIISRQELRDLVAYIASLKEPAPMR